jgi:hypothetical protein
MVRHDFERNYFCTVVGERFNQGYAKPKGNFDLQHFACVLRAANHMAMVAVFHVVVRLGTLLGPLAITFWESGPRALEVTNPSDHSDA